MICFQKTRQCIAINENSNEIFELKYNSINKSEFNNIFEFYSKNNGITYKTMQINENNIINIEMF